MNEIELKLRNFISELTENKEAVFALGLEDSLSDIGLNSIKFIELVVAIESESGIEFDDEDLDIKNFENLNKLISYIEGKI
ncbi:acyl carrier protein [Paenibacillus pinihumi]|uniref:acyl carrier protein n=1 Tax=Paenibacillus pinihumi TaxID=669462 RepID=UPI00041847D7|nr:acyl carrier protein [Paenibacillus pinihumi]